MSKIFRAFIGKFILVYYLGCLQGGSQILTSARKNASLVRASKLLYIHLVLGYGLMCPSKNGIELTILHYTNKFGLSRRYRVDETRK